MDLMADEFWQIRVFSRDKIESLGCRSNNRLPKLENKELSGVRNIRLEPNFQQSLVTTEISGWTILIFNDVSSTQIRARLV